MWVGHGSDEVVDRIERLEALLGMWDGGVAESRCWIDAETRAKCVARESVEAMIERAALEERVGLERQVAAAKLRLTRELGRFLLCLVPEALDLNQVFHDSRRGTSRRRIAYDGRTP